MVKPALVTPSAISRVETEPNRMPVSEAWRMITTLRPSTLSLIFSASWRRFRLFASICARCASKRFLFSSVARRAFLVGSRKLRAKPGFTFTTSPIWPRRSIRSRRMTSMFPFSLLNHVRQQAEEAGALDGLGQNALLLRRDRGDAGRHDLAALGDEPAQQTDVLVIDLRRVIARERAGLAAAEERATATAATT